MRLTEQGKIFVSAKLQEKTLYELDNVVEHITSDGPLTVEPFRLYDTQ